MILLQYLTPELNKKVTFHMLLKLLMISTFERVPLLVANVANVQERLVVVRFANYVLAGFFSHKLVKEQGRSTLWSVVALTFFVHQFTFHLNLKLKDVEVFDREGGAL